MCHIHYTNPFDSPILDYCWLTQIRISTPNLAFVYTDVKMISRILFSLYWNCLFAKCLSDMQGIIYIKFSIVGSDRCSGVIILYNQIQMSTLALFYIMCVLFYIDILPWHTNKLFPGQWYSIIDYGVDF